MQQPTAGVSYRIGPQSARSAFHAPYAGMQLLRAQQLNAWQASPEVRILIAPKYYVAFCLWPVNISHFSASEFRFSQCATYWTGRFMY